MAWADESNGKVSYSPDYKSSRDLNREVDRLGNMLISGPDSKKYKVLEHRLGLKMTCIHILHINIEL